MENFLDTGPHNYVVLREYNLEYIDQSTKNTSIKSFWKMFFGGACSKIGSCLEVVLENPNAEVYPHPFNLQLKCTNNEVEYEYLVQGLHLAQLMKIREMIVMGYSELVKNHIIKRYNIRKSIFKAYARRVYYLIQGSNSFNTMFIPRGKNQRENSLAMYTSLFSPSSFATTNSF